MIKVLFADKHEMVRESVAIRINNTTNIRVAAQTSTGKETIERAKSLSPDVIILELILDDMTDARSSMKCLKLTPNKRL